MSTIARGSVTIVDLTDGRTIALYLSANKPDTQVYDGNVNTYSPNWTETGNPLVITPEVYVSGMTGDQIAHLINVKWTFNGSTEFPSGITASLSNPYSLTVSRNMTDMSQYKFECEGIYVDTVSKVQTQVKSSITFTKAQNSGDSLLAISYAPQGTVFDGIPEEGGSGPEYLTARCDLWRGGTIDNTNVLYKWYIRTSTVWEVIEGSSYGITGFNTNTITIPASAVLNFASFKCEVTDNDSASITYNVTVNDIISFIDIADPYLVSIDGADKITSQQPTTKLTPYLEQGGERFPEGDQETYIWNWIKLNSNGEVDTAWRGSGSVSSRVLDITQADVTGSAIFVVDVSIP